MSLKALLWIVLAAIALAAVLLFNYWASFQPLSTLVYAGIVLALLGLANLALPFRFLGIRKRAVGALVLIGGIVLGAAALFWPASITRVAEHKTQLDHLMPEYQFSERHAQRVHARPEQVMEAVRQATLGDLKSYVTLMKIRGAVLRRPFQDPGNIGGERVLDALSEGFMPVGGSEREIVMGGIGKMRPPRPKFNNPEEFAAYRQEGVKVAFNFHVEDAGDGWSKISTETRVIALDDSSRRVMGAYWRFIVPGSGLLRREWLDGIRRRAEKGA